MSYFAANKGRLSTGTYNESGLKDEVFLEGPPDSKDSGAETERSVETSGSSSGANTIQKDGFQRDEEGYVEAYTDGACSKHGSTDAKAGIGVWFDNDSPHNISKPASTLINNSAEVEAVIEAAKEVQRAGENKIKIYTDSQFVMKNVDQGMIQYKTNRWLNSHGEPVKDKEMLLEMEEALQSMGGKLKYVKGHDGVYGNEKADELARQAIKKQ